MSVHRNMEVTQEQFRFYPMTRKKLGVSVVDVHRELTELRDEQRSSLRSIQRWFQYMESGSRINIAGAARSGRSRSTRTPDFINAVQKSIEGSHSGGQGHHSCRDVVDHLNVDHSTIDRIFNDNLHLRCVCVFSVDPRELTEHHRQPPVNCAKYIHRILLGLSDEKYNSYVV